MYFHSVFTEFRMKNAGFLCSHSDENDFSDAFSKFFLTLEWWQGRLLFVGFLIFVWLGEILIH
jgi:hypothetical protein